MCTRFSILLSIAATMAVAPVPIPPEAAPDRHEETSAVSPSVEVFCYVTIFLG
jgi:hypothetical protein